MRRAQAFGGSSPSASVASSPWCNDLRPRRSVERRGRFRWWWANGSAAGASGRGRCFNKQSVSDTSQGCCRSGCAASCGATAASGGAPSNVGGASALEMRRAQAPGGSSPSAPPPCRHIITAPPPSRVEGRFALPHHISCALRPSILSSENSVYSAAAAGGHPPPRSTFIRPTGASAAAFPRAPSVTSPVRFQSGSPLRFVAFHPAPRRCSS